MIIWNETVKPRNEQKQSIQTNVYNIAKRTESIQKMNSYEYQDIK